MHNTSSSSRESLGSQQGESKKSDKRMKTGNAVGPDGIPMETWKSFGEEGIEGLTKILKTVVESGRMPDDWRESVIGPIYKNKGDVQDCGNYSGIKLISHTRKIWERVIDARLREMVKSSKGRTVGMYEITERYVKAVQDMYKGCRTKLRTPCGETEEFEVTVGVHQGSALSPFLFLVILECLTKDIRRQAPWDMLFAAVICTKTREEAERRLESWRHALERRGLKVNRKKTEYLCTGGGEKEGSIKIQGEVVNRVKDFKYLGQQCRKMVEVECDEIKIGIKTG
ncbi:uncharacterized protein LOC125029925 [Penaeus chinensis]|uniref:uncharacterized protein LOC125029925 n=1 Tax=Penaeus chinensis TaxID=139456 RepID=UPI001FB5823F|nr:uncharacterized protein LOC125029925 [Penaeus chinensis]